MATTSLPRQSVRARATAFNARGTAKAVVRSRGFGLWLVAAIMLSILPSVANAQTARPTVTGLSATAGSVLGGTSVNISGSNFTSATAVKFGSANATGYVVNTSNSITATAPIGISGKVDVTVTNALGTSTTSSSDQFTYYAPPSVAVAFNRTTFITGQNGVLTLTVSNNNIASLSSLTGISIGAAKLPTGLAGASPATTCSGATASYSAGTGLALSGASLASGASCTVTLSVTATSSGFFPYTTGVVTATGPVSLSGAPGSTSAGAAGSTLDVGAVYPTSGPTDGGVGVTLTGSGFSGVTAVKFGSADAISFVIGGPNTIYATVPAGTSGAVDVTVTDGLTTSSAASGNQFTYYAAPTVTPSFSPPAMTTGQNGTLTLVVTNPNVAGLAALTGIAVAPTKVPASLSPGTPSTTCAGATASYVAGSGLSLSGASLASGASCTVTLPVTALAAGGFSYTTGVVTATGPMSLTGAAGTTGGAAASTPTVTALSRTTGAAAGGTSVTLTGTNFSGVTAVKFGATNAASYVVNSTTTITATAPAGTAGVVNVTVTNASGTSANAAANQFTYIAAPMVTSVSPAVGPTAGGTAVIINGTDFTGATAVGFGATPATTFTVVSATQITATAPAGTGTVDIRVTTSGGISATGAADQYTYVAAPTVTLLSPTTGPAGGGTSVVLTGTNLSGATAVAFGVTAATAFTVDSATQITATAPAGTGAINVRVTTDGGTSGTAAGNQYTYVAAPTVTSLSPTTGPTAGGTSVVLTGTNLSGATAVVFGTTPATGFTVNSATQITATAPAGTGTVDVQVTTTGGTSATGAGDQFTYVAAPTVTAISPTTGPTTGGTTVAITGTGFTGATAVTFGATAATGFTVISSTSASATAPAGTGTVDVRVTTTGGTSATSAADQFTFVAAPTVTSISPAAGSTAGGASVVLTGTNLTAATAVVFGATPAQSFTVNSATQITAVSPAGSAGTLNVRAVTPGGTSATAAGNQFTYVVPGNFSVTGIPATMARGTSATVTVTPSLPPPGGSVVFSVSLSGPAGVTASVTTLTFTTATPQTFTLSAGAGGPSGVKTLTYSVSGASAYAYNTPSAGGTTVASPPAASSFTYGSIVPYNVGGAPATLLSVAGSATNSPTSYAVGSATTAGGGSVSIDSSGQVSFTPAVGRRGNDSFTYTATNADGTSAPATVTVTVGDPTFATSLAGSGVRGSALSGVQVNVSGGAAPYTCATTLASGALPAGTQLNADCTLTGTPTASGSFNFAVGVTDSSTGSSPFTQTSGTLTLTVAAPTLIMSPAAGALPGATAGAAYSQTLTASGGTSPYSYSVTAGALPSGVAVSSGGILSGAPTTTGTFNFTVTATDSSTAGSGGPYTTANSYSLNVTQSAQTISFTSTAPASAVVGGAIYVPTATATSGLSVAFSIDPSASSVCGISAGKVSFIGAGSCVVNADQAGNASYAAASRVQQSFAVAAGVPTVANVSGVVVAHNSAGTTIDLSASITGTHSGIAIGVAPAHGTTSVAADVVTYTPTTGYYGADGFTYTATGPGGTSAPASVSLTVVAPSAPVSTNRSGVAVAYDSAGAVIDLSSSVTGVHSSIAVATPPAHGTVSVAGDVVSYTPAAGYYGPDSFTYTATGPGGTSAPATVSLSVATPAVPSAAPVSANVAYNSVGQAVTLAPSGVYASLEVAAGPAHGTVTISGTTATYTPVTGYFGADGFTYTATGPGGTSVPAAVSVTVATPAVPTVAPVSVNVPYNSAGQAIILQPSGVYASLSTATAPAHGMVSISGTTATYTPAAGYYGTDSFTYTATGPGGTSAAATVSVAVATPAAPTAADRSGVAVAYDSAGTAIDLSISVTGVHSGIAIATGPAHGTVGVAGDVVTFTPTAGYYGPDGFTYTATGPGGTSAPATVNLSVATPAAPFAAPVSANVAYNSVGQAVTLSPSGVYTSVAAATGPAHGTVTISGTTATYVPIAGYFGGDSFTYTATGPGGTSAPATVSLTVATPAAPTVANVTANVPYNSAGQAITLRPSGVYATLTVATGPSHGAVSISGTTATYTPANGDFGADSFTYTATGPGGTSAPATVSLTVATPAAPTVANVTAAVPYNSAGQAITLQPSGVYASLEMAAGPAHGTVTISGTTATYTPVTGYFGADGFTYTATGPGGASAPATVSVTVANPPAPTVTAPPPTTTPTTGGGTTAVDLGTQTSGTATSYQITTAPTNGGAIIETIANSSGTAYRLKYTPAANFLGTDTVTVVAIGPGGQSAPATFTFQVPGRAPDLSVQAVTGGSVTVQPTTNLVGGPFQALRITRAPAFGTATVSGLSIIFSPGATGGSASFDYVIDLPFGASAPGTVTVGVSFVPGVQTLTATTLAGRPVTVRISAGAQGPITGAAITGVAPAGSGTAVLVQGGTSSTPTWDLAFTPTGTFTGQSVVSFTLTNASGTSPGTLTVTVTPRADPGLDADVRGVISSQADSARRFASAQVDNFHRRLDQVRDGDNHSSNGLALNLGFAADDRMNDPRTELAQRLGLPIDGRDDRHGVDDRALEGVSPQAAGVQAQASTPGVLTRAAEGRGGGSAVGVWAAGGIDWGRRDGRTGERDYRFSTSGLSAGADVKVSETLIVGGGVGYGYDRTKIGTDSSLSEAESWVGVIYGGWRPTDGLHISGLIGGGSLDFESRRWASTAAAFAFGERSGSLLFGSLEASVDRTNRGLRWSPYARLETASVTLDAFTETGAGIDALAYDRMSFDSLSSTLGVRFGWLTQRRNSTFAPSASVEWAHAFDDAGGQGARYADWASSPLYIVPLTAWSRDTLSVDLEGHWSLGSNFEFAAGYRGSLGSDVSSHSIRLSLLTRF